MLTVAAEGNVAESLDTRLLGLAARRDATRPLPSQPGRFDLAHASLAVRWGALCFAAISVFTPLGSITGSHLVRDAIGLSLLGVYGVVRTLEPLRATATTRELYAPLALEAALCTVAVLLTGGFSSPLLLMVGSALLIAGLLGGTRGFGVAVGTVLLLLAAGAAGASLSWMGGVRSAIGEQRLPELLVMGGIGAYAHRVLSAEDSQYHRLRWMSELHALMFDLYRLAADHPGLFTVEGAVQATISRLQEVLEADAMVVLLRDPTAEGSEQPWEVASSEGVALERQVTDDALPAALRACIDARHPELRPVLGEHGGIASAASSGLYAPILVRGNLVGLLALERCGQPAFGAEDAEAVGEVARHAGLAIDNARFYQRVRNLGAEDERERIARELHDRVGQSLAAIAFNIDRLSASLPRTTPGELGSELATLSTQVRSVNAQIRGKLAELRGGPSTSVDLVRLLRQFLVRVEMRSNLSVRFEHDLGDRLPELVEREIWRIACEAIRNAERHSGGLHLFVTLRATGDATLLEVSDDGRGPDTHSHLRSDAYGLLGMRERADRLGATLVVEGAPGQGTTVRLRVPSRR